MRFWIAVFVVCALAIGVVLALDADSGYVLIRLAGWSVEMSVAVLIGIVFLLLVAVLVLFMFVLGLGRLPSRVREYREVSQARRARQSLVKGLVELSEGKWDKAEQDLVKHADNSETPLLHYLGAARAAQLQQSPERRDKWLHKAHQAQPDAELAIGLAQAELQLLNGQLPQALATLELLKEKAPKHKYVLKLLLLTHHRLSDWDALSELLPQARRQHVFGEAELRQMSLEVHERRLTKLAAEGDKDALRAAWDDVPLELWDEPGVLAAYAETLHAKGLDDTAAEVVKQGLKREWDEPLVLLFGQLSVKQPGSLLQSVESWLKKYGDRPALLLTAGRVCVKNELWGKARSYLQESAALESRPETWRELGMLLERIGEEAAALEAYRAAAQESKLILHTDAPEAVDGDVPEIVELPETRVVGG